MNLITRKTSFLKGIVPIPASKSQSIRALFFGLLASGESTVSHLLFSDDIKDALRVIQALGASIVEANHFKITSRGCPFSPSISTLDTGNSGLTTHFILPLLGLRKNPELPIVVDCGEQMRFRPIHPLIKALRDLGLNITYLKQEERFPILVSGSLKGGWAEVSGVTSQYLSALLIALPCAVGESHLTVHNLQERPYVEMTLSWLRAQGIQYTHTESNQKDVFHIQGQQHYKPFITTISGDFSSASYFIAAAALLPGAVEIQGLTLQDPQGDKCLVTLLQAMGAHIEIQEHSLLIQGGRPLQGLKIDARDIPDLLPTLAVIGTQALGQTEIFNVSHARLKETDRIHAMTQELRQLGARVVEHPDGMTVYPSELRGTHIQGYGDHRTVMALSLAGILAQGETYIAGGEAIDKTFPDFVSLMQNLGAQMEMRDV